MIATNHEMDFFNTYFFDDEQIQVLLQYATSREQRECIRSIVKKMNSNFQLMKDGVRNTAKNDIIRKQKFLEIVFSLEPQISRVMKILLAFCTKESIDAHRDEIIEYYVNCYKQIDYGDAIIFYHAYYSGEYMANTCISAFRQDENIFLHIPKGTKKYDLIQYAFLNFDYIDKISEKKWTMEPTMLGKLVARRLCYFGFGNTAISKLLDLLFPDNSILSTFACAHKPTNIADIRRELNRDLEKDWFNKIDIFLTNIKQSNSEL